MKKYLKLICTLIISTVMSLSLTSCNLFSGLSSIKTLMQPPSLTNEQMELTNALERHVGKNIMLKYPRSGDNRTAFIECDLDGSGVNEVIAFHMAREAGADVKMNVLKKQDDQWQWVCDTTDIVDDSFSRTDILSIAFEDLDGDGMKEIITGWYQSTSRNNCLTVFKYDGQHLSHLFSVAYTASTVVDLDSDGKNELFVVSLDYSAQTGSAAVYKFTDKGIERTGMTDIDGKVTSYAQIKTGRLYKTNTMAVFIDGYKSANEMITEVIYLKDNKLHNPFYSPAEEKIVQQASNAGSVGSESASGMTMATYRSNTLTVCDVNKDGYYDIPLSVEMPTVPDSPADSKISFASYFSYDGEKAENVFNGIIDSNEGYTFELPGEWLGNVTLISDRSKRCVSIAQWNGSPDDVKNQPAVLTFRTFLKEEWGTNANRSGEYYYLAENAEKTLVYAVSIGKADGLSPLNLAEISNRFTLIAQ